MGTASGDLADAESDRTRRFLIAFGGIEKRLEQIVSPGQHIPFSDLVTRAARLNRTVRSFELDLREYADLRNALVHERGDGRAIAEPYESTARRIGEIRQLLEMPPLLVDTIRVPKVETCAPNDRVGAVAGKMLAGSFSQLPVYADGMFVALLTAGTIARWLGKRLLTDDIQLVEEEDVAAVLEFSEYPDNYQVMARTSTVLDALDAFDDFFERGRDLDGLIVTNSGKPSEKPLTIVTTFDFPKLNAAARG